MLCIWVKVLFTMLAHVILFISKCLTPKFCAANSAASSKVLHFLNYNSLKFFLFCKANVSLPVNIFYMLKICILGILLLIFSGTIMVLFSYCLIKLGNENICYCCFYCIISSNYRFKVYIGDV